MFKEKAKVRGEETHARTSRRFAKEPGLSGTMTRNSNLVGAAAAVDMVRTRCFAVAATREAIYSRNGVFWDSRKRGNKYQLLGGGGTNQDVLSEDVDNKSKDGRAFFAERGPVRLRVVVISGETNPTGWWC